MSNNESLLLSLEAKRNEFHRLAEQNDASRREIENNTEYLEEQNKKLEKEIVRLESRKLTIKKVEEKIGSATTTGTVVANYRFQDIQRGGLIRDIHPEKLADILPKQLGREKLVLLFLFLISILLHFGGQLRIDEYSSVYPASYSQVVSMGEYYIQNYGSSATLTMAKGLTYLFWLPSIGYAFSAFLMLRGKKEYTAVSVISGAAELILFVLWWSIRKKLLFFVSYFYWNVDMNLSFSLKVYVYVIAAICICVYPFLHKGKKQEINNKKESAERGFGQSHIFHIEADKQSVQLAVSNYNRLSEFRMFSVDCSGTEGIDGFSLQFVDYGIAPLTRLVADLILCDYARNRYIIHDCIFNRFRQRDKSFSTEKIRIRSDLLPMDRFEDAEVIVKQYVRAGISKTEIPCYEKNMLTREQQFLLKKKAGSDAVVMPEIYSSSWQCICGNINSDGQNSCCLCGRGKGSITVREKGGIA